MLLFWNWSKEERSTSFFSSGCILEMFLLIIKIRALRHRLCLSSPIYMVNCRNCSRFFSNCCIDLSYRYFWFHVDIISYIVDFTQMYLCTSNNDCLTNWSGLRLWGPQFVCTGALLCWWFVPVLLHYITHHKHTWNKILSVIKQ